jgi:hypothetical protein
MWLLLITPTVFLLTLLVIAARRRPARTREAMITIEGYRREMAALAPTDARGADAHMTAQPPATVRTLAVNLVVPMAREVVEAADEGDAGPAGPPRRDDEPADPVH